MATDETVHVDGNTARQIDPLQTPGLRDWAAHFLADDLPEALRPTPRSHALEVALVWGRDQVLAFQEVPRGRSLTVGESPHADLQIFHPALKQATPIIQPFGNGFRILIPKDAPAHIRVAGEDIPAEALADKADAIDVPVRGFAYELGFNDRVSLEFGQLRLIARYTRALEAPKRPLGERLDVAFFSTITILFLVGLLFDRMIAITDLSHTGVDDGLLKNGPNAHNFVPVPPRTPPLISIASGTQAAERVGQVGTPTATEHNALPSNPGTPVVDLNRHAIDQRRVLTSGLVGLLDPAEISKILGPSGAGTAVNELKGGTDPNGSPTNQYGTDGLGTRGDGPGGSGKGPIDIGGIDGHGTGPGLGGLGTLGVPGTEKPATRFVPGTTHIVGGLSAEVVGRIVRRHWNEIKYCFEKELQKDPNLDGKLAVEFEIGPVGDVLEAAVRENDLHNPAVADCVLDNVRRWQFPAPAGGGVVNVNYPFLFSAGR